MKAEELLNNSEIGSLLSGRCHAEICGCVVCGPDEEIPDNATRADVKIVSDAPPSYWAGLPKWKPLREPMFIVLLMPVAELQFKLLAALRASGFIASDDLRTLKEVRRFLSNPDPDSIARIRKWRQIYIVIGENTNNDPIWQEVRDCAHHLRIRVRCVPYCGDSSLAGQLIREIRKAIGK